MELIVPEVLVVLAVPSVNVVILVDGKASSDQVQTGLEIVVVLARSDQAEEV